MYSVYAHISPSNKYYIGITGKENPEDRWGKNGIRYRAHNQHFWQAIQKYVWDFFEHEILASNITKEEAENFEKILIAKLKSNNRQYGYNKSIGGEISSLGVKHSQETKQKMSESQKGHICLEETRKKMSEARKGKPLSEEHKRKLSEARKGKPMSEETKQKLSEANVGKKYSEERKQQMSEISKNISYDTRKKMSESHKGHVHSEEQKRKMSESGKNRIFSEQHKQNLKEAWEIRKLKKVL